MPTISVIMGVYKERPDYLEQAIESILHQTYSDFEFLIVLDDPGNAALLHILKCYETEDSRIRVLVNDRNIGLALSLNRAIFAAQGIYLARMDADDISLPDRFLKQADFMDEHPEVSVLGTNKIVIDEEGKEYSKGSPLPSSPEGTAKTLKYANIMVHPSVMMRKDDIDKIGGYRDFPTSQDYDLWSRLLTAGMKICNLDDYLIKYRINSSGVTMGKSYKQALVGRYIRALEKERISTGATSDSFSRNNLELYLEKNNVSDPSEARKYQEARALLENGRAELKRHHFLSGTLMLLSAGKKHPLMRPLLLRQIMSVLVKKTG